MDLYHDLRSVYETRATIRSHLDFDMLLNRSSQQQV